MTAGPVASDANGAPHLSQSLAVVTVLKGMIGSGVLGLPYVCGKLRLGIAAPGMVVTASVGAFSVWRLIECKDILAGKRLDPGSSGASEDEDTTATEDDKDILGLGPLARVGKQCFGVPGIAIAAFGILASQMGFAVSYVDIVIETLSESYLLGSVMSVMALRLLTCAVLCCLCMLRTLSSLAWLSGLALLIYGYLLVSLIRFGSLELMSEDAPDWSEAWLPIRWDSFGSWFGTAIFAQEAIVISQYVYDDMRLPDRRQFLPVLYSSFGLSGALFTFVGTFGYLAYGEKVKNVFYLNFPPDSADVTIGEVVLCVVLLFTFALQMYPVMSFMEAAFLDIHPGDLESDLARDKAAAKLQSTDYEVADLSDGESGFDEASFSSSSSPNPDNADSAAQGALEKGVSSEGVAAAGGKHTGPSSRSDVGHEARGGGGSSGGGARRIGGGGGRPRGRGVLTWCCRGPRMAKAAGMRCLTVMAMCGIAAGVPNLACISGYSGCFAMSSIGFFMPALCHWKLLRGQLSLAQSLGNWLLLCVGVAALVFGTISTSC